MRGWCGQVGKAGNHVLHADLTGLVESTQLGHVARADLTRDAVRLQDRVQRPDRAHESLEVVLVRVGVVEPVASRLLRDGAHTCSGQVGVSFPVEGVACEGELDAACPVLHFAPQWVSGTSGSGGMVSRPAAESTRVAAAQLGAEAGHPEIVGWGHEMTAWFALTQGRFRQAVAASRRGQAIAEGTSVHVQLIAQEAKARRASVSQV